VRWYLSKGADPNAKVGNGGTPMTYAAREASLSTLKMLVDYGGQIKGTDIVAQAVIGHSWRRLD
jgi:ankyrin repeat protein